MFKYFPLLLCGMSFSVRDDLCQHMVARASKLNIGLYAQSVAELNELSGNSTFGVQAKISHRGVAYFNQNNRALYNVMMIGAQQAQEAELFSQGRGEVGTAVLAKLDPKTQLYSLVQEINRESFYAKVGSKKISYEINRISESVLEMFNGAYTEDPRIANLLLAYQAYLGLDIEVQKFMYGNLVGFKFGLAATGLAVGLYAGLPNKSSASPTQVFNSLQGAVQTLNTTDPIKLLEAAGVTGEILNSFVNNSAIAGSMLIVGQANATLNGTLNATTPIKQEAAQLLQVWSAILHVINTTNWLMKCAAPKTSGRRFSVQEVMYANKTVNLQVFSAFKSDIMRRMERPFSVGCDASCSSLSCAQICQTNFCSAYGSGYSASKMTKANVRAEISFAKDAMKVMNAAANSLLTTSGLSPSTTNLATAIRDYIVCLQDSMTLAPYNAHSSDLSYPLSLGYQLSTSDSQSAYRTTLATIITRVTNVLNSLITKTATPSKSLVYAAEHTRTPVKSASDTHSNSLSSSATSSESLSEAMTNTKTRSGTTHTPACSEVCAQLKQMSSAADNLANLVGNNHDIETFVEEMRSFAAIVASLNLDQLNEVELAAVGRDVFIGLFSILTGITTYPARYNTPRLRTASGNLFDGVISFDEASSSSASGSGSSSSAASSSSSSGSLPFADLIKQLAQEVNVVINSQEKIVSGFNIFGDLLLQAKAQKRTYTQTSLVTYSDSLIDEKTASKTVSRSIKSVSQSLSPICDFGNLCGPKPDVCSAKAITIKAASRQFQVLDIEPEEVGAIVSGLTTELIDAINTYYNSLLVLNETVNRHTVAGRAFRTLDDRSVMPYTMTGRRLMQALQGGGPLIGLSIGAAIINSAVIVAVTNDDDSLSTSCTTTNCIAAYAPFPMCMAISGGAITISNVVNFIGGGSVTITNVNYASSHTVFTISSGKFSLANGGNQIISAGSIACSGYLSTTTPAIISMMGSKIILGSYVSPNVLNIMSADIAASSGAFTACGGSITFGPASAAGREMEAQSEEDLSTVTIQQVGVSRINPLEKPIVSASELQSALAAVMPEGTSVDTVTNLGVALINHFGGGNQ